MRGATRVAIKYLYTEYLDCCSNATGNTDVTCHSVLFVNFYSLIAYDIMTKYVTVTPAKLQRRATVVGGSVDVRATLLRGSWMLYLR